MKTKTLLLVLLFAPLLSFSQVTGQYPLMTINKNNGYSPRVGKLPVQPGDLLGRFQIRGWVTDGYYHPGAEIRSTVTGAVNGDGFPANLMISTGYPSLQSRMMITADGLVGIGTNTPAFELHTIGNTHTTGDFFGRLHIDDNGSADAAPNSYNDEAYFEHHLRANFATPPASTATAGGLLTLAPGNASADHQLFFAEDGLFHRQDLANAGAWSNNWQKLLSSADINGTPNRIARFTAPSSLGDSQLWDDGSQVGIRTGAPTAGYDVDIVGRTRNHGNLDITGNAYVDDNLSVGTTTVPAGYRLAVDGNIICEEVRVQLSTLWPDYVFEESYSLMSLPEVEASIRQNGHLPGMPAAREIDGKGLEVGAITASQQEKIEELFLHLIEMDKQLKVLQRENAHLKKELGQLQNR